MDGTDESDAPDIEALAAQMLGLEEDEAEDDTEYEEEDNEPQAGHPAWQQILSQLPAEYHAAIIPTLQEWDSGVSRRFQKIHDEYAPLKRFEEVDPDEIKEALDVYQALNNDPASTWEAIGRVYGLSPQQVSQVADESDDFDLEDLPPAVRDRLSKLDVHDRVLEAITGELLQRQESEKEFQEDAELEEYLDYLRDTYGDYDEDYVVGLIASGIDGEEAIGRFQQFTQQFESQPQRQSPRIMSGGGGIPNNESVNVSKLSNQDTQKLVEELLRLSQDS